MPTIPLVDVKAQYAPLIPDAQGAHRRGRRVRPLHPRPERRGVRGGGRRLPRRARHDRRRQRHRRDRARARRDGDRRGDEVICPAFTFYATPEAIVRRGATPVFADIDAATLNLDPEDVARRITPRTKAIMPVHLFGRPAPLAELAALGVPIVEDAAQAFGAEGVAHDRRRLDLQLLPDEEPLRPRRRRPRRRDRRGGRRPRAPAPLPRLARQGRLRARRLQLAPRRDPGRRAAALPAEPRRAGIRPAARRPRATPSSVSASSASCPPTTAGTSTTCTSSAARSATESPPR